MTARTSRCPSRATLLSGLYTHRSGVSANTLDLDYGNVALVPELLRQRGYATAFVGKYHLGAGTELEGKRRKPFDHWVGSIEELQEFFEVFRNH